MTARSRIVVAMSGGVDSSVAAALLREQGHDVIGMMLRLWSEPGREDSNRCCTPESISLARRAAAQLGIPFYVVDAKQDFRATVVEYFLAGYERGETPNPCIECNRKIRWTLLLEHAKALGGERMATGHYARVSRNVHGKVVLERAADLRKDQSYVLYALNQEQLQSAVFPIGDLQKVEVRSLAEKYSLPTATRRESQDLCFLAGGDYRAFLARNRPAMLVPGPIQDVRGAVIGTHTGLAAFTIGQRKAIGLQSAEPMYVVSKDPARNLLVVGSRSDLGSSRLTTGPITWTCGSPRFEPFRARVQIRYTSKEQPALVTPIEEGGCAQVTFDDAQRDITPGQAAVFYEGEVVVGGGIIHRDDCAGP